MDTQIPVVRASYLQPRIQLRCSQCQAQNEFTPAAKTCHFQCFQCEKITAVNVNDWEKLHTAFPIWSRNTAPVQKNPPPSSVGDSTSTSTSSSSNPTQSFPDVKKSSGGEYSNKGVVKDQEYYLLLGVDSTASQGDIKKGYYKMAKICHPDKNPDDPAAAQQFQKLSEAYQILGDPSLRERYDRLGKDGVAPEGGFANPKNFFNAMFGGGRFEEIIGEITFGMMEENTTQEEIIVMQTQRIVTLSEKLIQKLNVFVSISQKEIEMAIKLEIEDLKGELNGLDLLRTIGYIYEQEAQQHLGGLFGFFSEFTEKAHNIKETVSAVKSAVQLQAAQREIDAADESKKGAMQEEMLTHGMSTLWKVGKLDIERTLREVCEVILKDATVDKSTLKKRAETLRLIGKLYKASK